MLTQLSIVHIDLNRPHPALSSYLYVCLLVIEPALQQPRASHSAIVCPPSSLPRSIADWDVI